MPIQLTEVEKFLDASSLAFLWVYRLIRLELVSHAQLVMKTALLSDGISRDCALHGDHMLTQ